MFHHLVGYWACELESRAVLLPLTLQTNMVDVKVKDVVAGTTSEIGIELSSTAINLYEHVQITMKSVYIVYYVMLQRLLKAVRQSGE